ncbi:unnamed protein product [Urochloa humidicola]
MDESGSDDALDLVLERVDSHVSLIRAAAVCRRWRRAIADAGFLRQYRSLHGSTRQPSPGTTATAAVAFSLGSALCLPPRRRRWWTPAISLSTSSRAVHRHGSSGIAAAASSCCVTRVDPQGFLTHSQKLSFVNL